jgi:hypothetical protein
MARSNKRAGTKPVASTPQEAPRQQAEEIPPHLIKTLPNISGAVLVPGEQYAMRHDDHDPNDVIITSTQLMQNHVPEGTVIIRAVTDRTYVMSSLDPRPANSPLAMRGMSPPFNRHKGSYRNNLRPPRNHPSSAINATNAAVPTVGDSEFEEPSVGDSGAPQKTPEQIAQEEADKLAAEQAQQGAKPDIPDDSHLLDGVSI